MYCQTFVKKETFPAQYDTVGNEIQGAMDVKDDQLYSNNSPAHSWLSKAGFITNAMQTQIDSMTNLIYNLQNQIISCCQYGGYRPSNPNGNEDRNGTSENITLQNMDYIVLNQNAPNPLFREHQDHLHHSAKSEQSNHHVL